jgi:type II secretory pathway pseudopilin PulG
VKLYKVRHGFTLVELVVLCAVIAAVAGVAIPRYSQAMVIYRADSAARIVCKDLDLARTRAKMQARSVTVTLDPAADSLAIEGMKDMDHPSESFVRDLADEPYRASIGDADFGGDAVVIFNGFGLPDSEGSVELSCGDQSRTVRLDGASGKAEVE